MRGFITLASTNPLYLELATDLALSLRAFGGGPIALILGDELREQASAAKLRLFDHIVPLPAGYPRNIGKLYAPVATPFERTIFLDADCLALSSFDDLWDRLAPFGFALQGTALSPDQDRVHNMRSTAETMRRFGIRRYVKSNSGIIYFRKEAGMAVAEACLRCFHEHFGPDMNCDETLLGIVSGTMEIATMPPPLAMPWLPSTLEPHDTRYKLVHLFGRPKRATMRWLMNDVRRRRAAAGLPPEESVRQWRRKTTPWRVKLIRYRVAMWGRERLLRRRAGRP